MLREFSLGEAVPPVDLEEEVRGLKNLLSVAQVVVSSLDLPEVLQNILGSAMAIMDMPAGSIALYDPASERFTLHAHAGLSPGFVARAHWTLKPGGLTERILASGDLLVVEETADGPPYIATLCHKEGIHSLIAAPLQIQDQTVGILYLDDFRPRRFPAARLNLLSILSSFATMSIENARLHERTVRLACTDGLTGLSNHRHFKQVFQEELARAQRYGKSMSLIMFDVDDFKRFNDRFGHPCGDHVLVLIAEILRESLRECDHVFRYGGEEFIAILPETDIAEALLAGERIRHAVEASCQFRLRETPAAGAVLTVSVGVAAYPRDGSDLHTLLKAVDDLLYLAKRHGKNKVYHHL